METLPGTQKIISVGKIVVNKPVAKVLEHAKFCSPSRIKTSYLEYAKSRGVRATPDQLWTALSSLDQTYRVAPMHGDLHGENVRVRNGNAILIDFASVAPGPLTADLAALESWLAFELPPEEQGEDYQNELDNSLDRVINGQKRSIRTVAGS